VITLFNGEGGEFDATVTRMGRSDVDVEVGAHRPVEREAARAVHLLAGITANDRMDWLVEKATELGVASITPLVAERSVLKLKGERAEKNRVPTIHPAVTLTDWLKKAPPCERWVLSLSEGTQPLTQMHSPQTLAPVTVLSGPEGGLSPGEEAAALAAGFTPITLGPRVLRAETAPLAVLALLA
jgi:16S rRNA (uracil1498-N3)-methyltransferase